MSPLNPANPCSPLNPINAGKSDAPMLIPPRVVFALAGIGCVYILLLWLFAWLDHRSWVCPSVWGRIFGVMIIVPIVLLLLAGSVFGIYMGFFK